MIFSLDSFMDVDMKFDINMWLLYAFWMTWAILVTREALRTFRRTKENKLEKKVIENIVEESWESHRFYIHK